MRRCRKRYHLRNSIIIFLIYLESDDIDRSSSSIFYEKPGLSKLDNDDDSLNDTRRVRFSTAPIRVREKDLFEEKYMKLRNI